MDIEYLPSPLHLKYNSDIDTSDLLPIVNDIFPDLVKNEYKNDTLYLYGVNELIKLIHISKNTLGVVFAPEVIKLGNIKSAWECVEVLISRFDIAKFTDFNLQIKIVQPFVSKNERDNISRKLSPVKGYRVDHISLYPENNPDYRMRFSMVHKGEDEYGVLINHIYEMGKINKKDTSIKLEQLMDEFINSKKTKTFIKKVLSE